MTKPLPPTCERALLEQFLKAESMALAAVRSAQAQDVPAAVIEFLRRHEEEEADHLRQFESLLDRSPRPRDTLPRMPSQWWALAVYLFGYESLGLEFAKLLVEIRPDLMTILEDEAVHVGFFEEQVKHLLAQDETTARRIREAAGAWRRRLPGTVDRYLRGESLAPFREALRTHILAAIDARFVAIGVSVASATGAARHAMPAVSEPVHGAG